jgi:PAS domain S-box-containing protein
MVARDLTESVRTEIDLRLAAHAFDSLVDGVLISEADGRIDYVNQAYSDITGYAPAEIIGKSTNDLKSGLQPERFYEDIWESIAQHGNWQGRSWERRRNGTTFPAWLSVSAVRDATGAATHYVWIVREAKPDHRAQSA